MASKNDIVIVAAKRSAIGNFSGSLQNISAVELGAAVIKDVLKNAAFKPEEVEEVIMGQVLTAGCGQNPARQASIAAGLADTAPAYTINQVCGSGLKAVSLAAQSLQTGGSNFVIAGGQENMSLSQHAAHMRNGTKMGPLSLVDTMITDGLWDCFNNYHMGITAENIAKKFDISRNDQDEFAAKSQQKAEKAQKEEVFKEEITEISVKQRKDTIIFSEDEFPRHGTDSESLAKLRPAFDKEGSVTAGNASGINDGAAALLLTTREKAEQKGLKIMARIASFAQAGVAPDIMGTGPIPASKKALEIADWNINNLDLIEANEAFAAQAIAVNKEMGWDIEKVNINGGAIALGHPIGASGARVLVTLLHSLEKHNLHKGLATLCVGGGMGVAICVERE